MILEIAVEREKDVQLIDVNKESKKCEVTSLAMSAFLDFLGILRSCAYFRVSSAISRIIRTTNINPICTRLKPCLKVALSRYRCTMLVSQN